MAAVADQLRSPQCRLTSTSRSRPGGARARQPVTRRPSWCRCFTEAFHATVDVPETVRDVRVLPSTWSSPRSWVLATTSQTSFPAGESIVTAGMTIRAQYFLFASDRPPAANEAAH